MSVRVKHIILSAVFFGTVSAYVFGHDRGAIRFIENRGQWDKQVAYKAAIAGGDLYVLKNKLKYVFYQRSRGGHDGLTEDEGRAARENAAPFEKNLLHSIELSFEGANFTSSILALNKNRELINYIKGNDSRRWSSDVASYADLIIDDLYQGIDFHLFFESGNLKYDFIVSPGADPSQIRMKYHGQNELKLHEGKLVVGTLYGYFFENVPFSYTSSNGQNENVASEFHLDAGKITFNFPEGYDSNAELIIDPELIFSTYSGSYADNWGFTATYDDQGNLYSGGIVFDVGFPVTNGVLQPGHAAGWDIGILKYDSTGTNLLWATYLGGNFSETPQSIIVNSKGELVIYGTTSSPDFPITANSYQKNFLGGDPIYDTLSVQNPRLVGGVPFLNGSDIFLAILDPKGQALVGSTFIGGTENDGIMERFTALTKNYGDQFRGEVNLDGEDNIYVASNTSSPDFLIKDGFQTLYGGNRNDGVVMKFNADLSDLRWSTYVGGSGIDALYAVKVDSEGNVFAAGGSTSVDFPVTENAHKTEKPVSIDIDGVVVKIAPDGTQLLKSSYLGTSQYDQAYFLELDSSGSVYLLGQTQGNYLVTDGVYSNANSGQFIHKLGNDLDTTYYSTVIGSGSGSPDFSPTAFLINECENIFISGWGGALNHPLNGYIGGSTFDLPVTENAFQNQTDGTDFYLMVMLQDAKKLLYGTYFGELNGRGEHVDGGTSRFDKRGIVYQSVCGGCGGSSGFPTWPPNVWSQTNNSSNCNNAAFKFDLASLLARFDTDTEDFTNRGIREGCYPTTLVFLNESLGGEDFHWDFGEGTQSDKEDTIMITYEVPGTYLVSLTATDINTCVRESRANGMITVYDYDFGIMPDDSICYGESITLYAEGGIKYDWIPKDNMQNSNTPTPTASPDTTTVFSVKIEDANGCRGEDSLTIKVIPEIIADFIIEKSYDCLETPVLHFINNSVNARNFLWDFDDGDLSMEFEPTHQYEPSDSLRKFNISLTAGSSFCYATKKVSSTSVSTFVPNFISPNGDGKNDAFEVRFTDNIELYVFNRWGKEVYHAAEYHNNWSGTDLASGVYFYQIIFNDKKTTCNGWLEVMR